MATSTEEAVQRLKESRPPATDAFTYLTIVEKSLTPEILPALSEILDDAELTKDIGWDLVEMLAPMPGSAECLETVARLGNPREVILKVLEVMDKAAAMAVTGLDEEGDHLVPAPPSDPVDIFIALVGMLKILHGRLQVRAPSRFLHTTLDTVLRAYDPTSGASTAAIVDLVRSLSGRRRPVLPTRQSSTTLDTPFQATDPSQTAPDPEADGVENPAPGEDKLMRRLLQSFATCIIEAYVNSNNLEWAARILEYTVPERIVPGRKTMMQAYNEVEDLQTKDALVAQLVAVAADLGLNKLPDDEVRRIFTSEPCREPLAADDADVNHPESIQLSTGGFACLSAYWMFSSDVFDAHYQSADINVFPELHEAFKNLATDDPQVEIVGNPGTFESLVTMAVWLDAHKGTVPRSAEPPAKDGVNIMSYLHVLTLVSVFHPNIRVRNAATFMAGSVLHADPDEGDRLAILEDLMENCVFPSLQACAVTWIKEEMMAAQKASAKGQFASPEFLEKLQYTVFPDLKHLDGADVPTLWTFWTRDAPLHLQVANFALFLFGGEAGAFKAVAPAGMATAVELRYVEPLVRAAKTLTQALEKGEVQGPGQDDAKMQLGILVDALTRVPLQ